MQLLIDRNIEIFAITCEIEMGPANTQMGSANTQGSGGTTVYRPPKPDETFSD